MQSGTAYWLGDSWNIVPDQAPNLEHIETLNGGKTDGIPVMF